MEMSRTTCITQDGPANALALNKDYSQVVIAGRNGKKFIPMCVSCIMYKTHYSVISSKNIMKNRTSKSNDYEDSDCSTSFSRIMLSPSSDSNASKQDTSMKQVARNSCCLLLVFDPEDGYDMFL
jgi:hypothetical protein